MDQKKFVQIIFGILVLIILGAAGYFVFLRKPTPPVVQPSPTPTLTLSPIPTPLQQTPKPVSWEDLIPEIRKVLGPTFMGVKIEEASPISIIRTADITGDGIPEALVYLGNYSYLTLMRLENDKPVVAQFKKKDGKISTLLFSERLQVGVVMLSEKNAIFDFSWSIDALGKLSSCSVDAYQWNSQTKIFEFNTALSKEIKPDFCSKIPTGK